MLKTSKDTTASISVNLIGESVVDDVVVARYSAYISPDDDSVTITTIILDREKYRDQCSGDEPEFEDEVYDSQQQIMDAREEILGVYNPDDEPGGDDESEDGGDDDDEEKAGDEETIIP